MGTAKLNQHILKNRIHLRKKSETQCSIIGMMAYVSYILINSISSSLPNQNNKPANLKYQNNFYIVNRKSIFANDDENTSVVQINPKVSFSL